MPDFDINELFIRFRYPILIFFGGGILLAVGIIYFKTGFNFSGEKVEILNNEKTATVAGSFSGSQITAEIAGEVISPGVYKLPNGSRVDDLLIIGGGLTVNADRGWTDKYLNRASKLTDGQKVYIPKVGQQTSMLGAKSGGGDQSGSSAISSDSQTLININTASSSQ